MAKVQESHDASSTKREAACGAGPNWDHVPFPVSCGRCGADLRGRSEPRCPKCDLAFDWDDVVPLEDLRCAECGYYLLGLSQPRCPECGTAFEWSDVLGAARSRQNRLFEHCRRQPVVRSLLRTWWLAAFRPRRLWAEFSIHDPPKVGPLVVFMLLQWVVFACGWPAAAAVADPVMNGLARWFRQADAPGQPATGPSADERAAAETNGLEGSTEGLAPNDADPDVAGDADPDVAGDADSEDSDDSGDADLAGPADTATDGLDDVGPAGAAAPASAAVPPMLDLAGRRRVGGGTPAPVRFVYPWRPRRNYLTFMGVWYLATFGSFQLFIVTKRRYRMRWQQILRIYVHATAFAALCTALWCALEAMVDTAWLITTPPRPLMNRIYLGLMQGMFVLGVGITWLYLWMGFSRYLKLRYAWAAAPACLLLGNRLAALVMIFWPAWLRLPPWLRLPF